MTEPKDTNEQQAVRLGTVAAVGFEDFPPGEWLACFRQLGCRVVQAYRNPKAGVTVEQIKDAIAQGEMPCDSLHGIFGEQYDPSAPKEEARRFAVDTFKAEGELALALGGSLVVVHCSTIRHEGVSTQERTRRLAQLEKSITELGRFGHGMGVRYAFENLPAYHPIGSDVAELAAILDKLQAPSTGICFDTGHANMVSSATEELSHVAKQMIYLHFSDNSSRSDDHDMPTCGTLDCHTVARQVRQIGYSGTMMLEVFLPIDRLKELIDEGCGERLAKIVAIANGQEGP